MSENKKMLKIFVFISILFITVICYLSYFEIFLKEEVVNNSYNKRMWITSSDRLRGSIMDRNGEVLAYSTFNNDSSQTRIYPYDELYCHVIGYNSNIYGNSFLESKFQKELTGDMATNKLLDIKNLILGNEIRGNDLVLTINHDLQTKALELLEENSGAIVALDPNTGEILSMVSNPGFDPHSDYIESNWSSISTDDNSNLMSRAIQGTYPPGSIFKIITSTAAIESGLDEYIADDQGSVTIDGKIYSNAGNEKYGIIDLGKAFSVSSNVYFASLAIELGSENLLQCALDYGFNKPIDFDLNVKKSEFSTKAFTDTDLASTGIGQGITMVTPLHMALVASAVANDGIVMEPYLVSAVMASDGTQITKKSREKLFDVIDKNSADILKKMMIDTVETGTGKKAAITGITVAGKTGTAQNEKSDSEGKDHAWFVGFAPADDPQIAVAVFLEYSGSSGGNAAAPIAGDLMEFYLK
ncbi:peptidoglycan D,D-transpeptidase FtsI family protein [Alkalibacter mobilis]|uniref:peptidoglycan D,D-transpeptidase FtsI family protein n=1 Tax=Alkalibacter mobilis TaxID=2787712 RepID=UPI0018A0951C|nr:penicillin-binding transpeptidase domain-containing protein [Alkalibacter mobilis]MBF7095727.1 peptidoglycan glycosyltransferase [Alkalibacter mobilis]